MKPRLAVIPGDPSGIGPELIARRRVPSSIWPSRPNSCSPSVTPPPITTTSGLKMLSTLPNPTMIAPTAASTTSRATLSPRAAAANTASPVSDALAS